MLGLPAAAVIAEGLLLGLFLSGLFCLRRKTRSWDLALWVVVWAARSSGALIGAKHITLSGANPTLYVALQSLAAVLLLLAILRAELRVCRQKLAKVLAERIQW